MTVTAVDIIGNAMLIWTADDAGQTRFHKMPLPQDADALMNSIPPADMTLIAPGAAESMKMQRPLQTLPAKLPNLSDLSPIALATGRAWVLPAFGQNAPAALLSQGALALWGMIAANPKFDGVICLCTPLQTHFVQISAQEIISATQSITGHWMAGNDNDTMAPTPTLLDAAADTISRPQGLAQRLGSAQAALQMGQISAKDAQARSAGALIGADLAAARPYWLGQQIAILDAGGLADAYAAALKAQGAIAELTMTADKAGAAALHAYADVI